MARLPHGRRDMGVPMLMRMLELARVGLFVQLNRVLTATAK